MGWWKIDSVETGAISCKLPSGHPGDDKTLLNAVPGRDAPGDLYNGDGPADVMGAAVKAVDDLFRAAWGRPARPDEMRACFNFVFNGWKRHSQPIGNAPPAGAANAQEEPA